jgi:hypothetical protein
MRRLLLSALVAGAFLTVLSLPATAQEQDRGIGIRGTLVGQGMSAYAAVNGPNVPLASVSDFHQYSLPFVELLWPVGNADVLLGLYLGEHSEYSSYASRHAWLAAGTAGCAFTLMRTDAVTLNAGFRIGAGGGWMNQANGVFVTTSGDTLAIMGDAFGGAEYMLSRYVGFQVEGGVAGLAYRGKEDDSDRESTSTWLTTYTALSMVIRL